MDMLLGRLAPEVLAVVTRVFQVSAAEVSHVRVLKGGMTNRSFVFALGGASYIIRVPAKGTEKLINRAQEARVYTVLAGREICDDVVFLDAASGCKITRYWQDARVCDPLCQEDVARCMAFLRRLHRQNIAVPHDFDIFSQIDFYANLRQGRPSDYADYARVREQIFGLRGYMERHAGRKTLTHIDAVPDNFLFYPDAAGRECLRLIDWEYAGMADPHLDLAMFAVYAAYDKERLDQLLDVYFAGACPPALRVKIYCYVAACGLLWSNWCEYKHSLGVHFGAYALRQYAYARDFAALASAELASAELAPAALRR